MTQYTVGSFFTVVIIVTIFFTAIALTSDEIISKNGNLDNASLDALSKTVTTVDSTYDPGDLTLGADNLTANSSFEGTDAFQREFLESKSEAEDKRSVFGKIFGVPDLMLNSIGIQQPGLVLALKSLLIAFITFFTVIAVYVAWKRGDVE